MMKIVSSVMLALILISTSTIAFSIQPVKATGGTIYIRADGSVDPPTAPIQRDGNLYTFTADIYDSIVVERDNIVIDGAGYTLQGKGSETGIDLSGRTNVTIKNTQIKYFYNGIYLSYSSGNIISGNNITINDYGVMLFNSSNNIISGNTFTQCGLFVRYSYHNVVVDNTVNGKPLVYLEGVADYRVSDAGQVILVNCDRIRVENLNLSHTSTGVQLLETKNSVISGNNITNNKCGVRLDFSSNNTISGNNITRIIGAGGVLLYSSKHNSLSGNNITRNSIYGVLLDSSSNNIISGNIVTNSLEGSILLGSDNNIISGNTFTNDGLDVGYSYHNVVVDNTVNGKPLVYLEGVADYRVSDAGQVILVNCDRIRVENLNLSHTSTGVQLLETKNSVISGNNITNNGVGVSLGASSNNTISGNNIATNKWIGVWLGASSNNTISGNNITNNRHHGVQLNECSNNIISGNNIANNGDGVYLFWHSSNNSISGNNITANNGVGVRLESSSNNWFYHNNFIDNGAQVYSLESINVWDDGYPSGGNYWSDYKGVDYYGGPYQHMIGSDGIGDAAYLIDENNADRYPLIAPFTAFDAGVWDGIEYFFNVISNSTVSNFVFDPSKGPYLKFNVTGDEGTTGFCRVTIPKSLLWAEDGWTITINNQQITNYSETEDENNTYLYFTYHHSTQTIVIQGTNVIPEFPSTLRLLVFLMLLTIPFTFAKKKRFKEVNT